MATGSTFASVNSTTLNDLDIPFLDKSEQAEIGLFLRSLVYQIIQQEEQALHTAQALKRAAMHTLFTRGLRGEAQKETEIGPLPGSWDVVQLGSLGRIGKRFDTKKGYFGILGGWHLSLANQRQGVRSEYRRG